MPEEEGLWFPPWAAQHPKVRGCRAGDTGRAAAGDTLPSSSTAAAQAQPRRGRPSAPGFTHPYPAQRGHMGAPMAVLGFPVRPCPVPTICGVPHLFLTTVLLQHLWRGASSWHRRGAMGDLPGPGAAARGVPFPGSRGWEGPDLVLMSRHTQLPALQDTVAHLRVRKPKVLDLSPKPRLQLLRTQYGPSRGCLSPAISWVQGHCV